MNVTALHKKHDDDERTSGFDERFTTGITRRPVALVVDDDLAVRKSLVRFLSLCSISTLQAASGDKALEVLASEPIDVIICDHEMPDMSGLELLRIAHDKFPNVRRVLFSGHRDEDLLREAVDDCGVELVLHKGTDPAVLNEKLSALRERITRRKP